MDMLNIVSVFKYYLTKIASLRYSDKIKVVKKTWNTYKLLVVC